MGEGLETLGRQCDKRGYWLDTRLSQPPGVLGFVQQRLPRDPKSRRKPVRATALSLMLQLDAGKGHAMTQEVYSMGGTESLKNAQHLWIVRG